MNVKVDEGLFTTAKIYRFFASDAVNDCLYDFGFSTAAPTGQLSKGFYRADLRPKNESSYLPRPNSKRRYRSPKHQTRMARLGSAFLANHMLS